jgi:uncharacterized protein (DUF2236 family)
MERRVDALDRFSLIDRVNGLGGILAGAANVIMQLSLAPVGYGVLESKVESGKLTRHPLKRFRTTFTYLAVALLGTDDERAAFRMAVDHSHASVRSGPESPVSYNAFDPELQLWVAACLYWGARDIALRFGGPMDDATADAFYEAAKPLGTTLQVKPEAWPATRADFEDYWQGAVERVSIDPPVRQYLYDVATLGFLPGPLARLPAGPTLFFTTGFLPPRFRQEMHLDWSDRQQRQFDRVINGLAAISNLTPAVLRRFPVNYFLWDFRVRGRLGLALV